MLVAQVAGGDPWPMAALVLLTGATLFSSRELARRFGVFVPGTLVTVLLLVVVLAWPEATHRHFGLLGYANANGALLATVVLAVAFTHATIDFVWHNPGVPLPLAILVGAGATEGYPLDEVERPDIR